MAAPDPGPSDALEHLLQAERFLQEEDTDAAVREAELAASLGGPFEAEAQRVALLARRRGRELRRPIAAAPGKVGAEAAQEEVEREEDEESRLAEDWLARSRSSGDSLAEAAALLAQAELAAAAAGHAVQPRLRAERRLRQALTLLPAPSDGEPAQASASAASAPSHRLRGAALRRLAAVCLEDGDVEGALEAAVEARALGKESGDKLGEATSLLEQASAHAYAQEPEGLEQAISLLQEALALVKGGGLKRLEAQVLCRMSGYAAACGRPQEALLFAQRGHALRHGVEETRALVEALGANRQGLRALQVAKDAVAKARGAQGLLELAGMQELLARELLRQGHLDQALLSFKEVLATTRQLGDRARELGLLQEVAQLQLRRKEPGKAASSLRDAVLLALGGGERGAALCALAEVEVLLGRHADAAETAAKAEASYREEGDARGQAAALMAACSAASAGGSAQKAMAFARHAYEVAYVAGHLDKAAAVQKRIAELLLARDSPEEALRAVGEAVKLWDELGDAQGLAEGLRLTASLHSRCGALQDALNVAQQALEMSQGAGDMAGEAHGQALLAELHTRAYEREDKRGDAHLQSESLANMLASAGAAQALAAHVRDKHLQAVTSLRYAQALMSSARLPPEDALRMARRAQALFHDTGDADGETQALTLAAHLLLPRGLFDEAAGAAGRALEVARAAGNEAAARAAEEAAAAVGRAREEQQAQGRRGPPSRAGAGRPGRPGRPGAAPAPGGAQPPGPPRTAEPQGEAALARRPAPLALDAATVRRKVMDMVRGLIGADVEVDADSALMENGMDSLSSIDFTNQVTRDFHLKGSQNLVFDFPTVSHIVDHVLQEGGQG